MSKVIDLHMHTNISSDGDFTPEHLMHLVYQAGLKMVAIADHNSTRAYPLALPVATSLDIKLIPAIELDAKYHDRTLHILGYGIDPYDEAIMANDEAVRQMDLNNSEILIEKVAAMGIHFDRDKVYQLSSEGIVVAEMIAEVALADPRNDDNPLLKPLRPGQPRGDNPYVNFYWDLCSYGKPGYVPSDYISLTEAIKLIVDAGGIPVFAHPGNNIQMDRAMALDIMSYGLKGIEAYSSYHTKEMTQFYLDLAKELEVFVTVGSDFHGKNKPAIKLGGVEVENEEELIETFLKQLD